MPHQTSDQTAAIMSPTDYFKRWKGDSPAPYIRRGLISFKRQGVEGVLVALRRFSKEILLTNTEISFQKSFPEERLICLVRDGQSRRVFLPMQDKGKISISLDRESLQKFLVDSGAIAENCRQVCIN
jgi:hypothetical protein